VCLYIEAKIQVIDDSAYSLAEDKGITVGVIETGAARPDDALIVRALSI
jgi:hypothetical protein